MSRFIESLGRLLVSVRCWWLGCEPHPQDTAPADVCTCVYCGGCVSYGDFVGYSRFNRSLGWLRHWMWRRWLPEKCPACGSRYVHRGDCDGIPF